MNQERPQNGRGCPVPEEQPAPAHSDTDGPAGRTGAIRVVRAYLVQDQDGRTLDRLTSVILLQDEWRALTKPQRAGLVAVSDRDRMPGQPLLRRLEMRGLIARQIDAWPTLTTFGEAVLAYRPDRTEGDQP